ncbi:hypothetical protein J4463_02540 [Candidatus Pacearchaeota archaeon]|nr:hypothetical protein [Candidatus Pacearchaeota archaeon]
MVRQDILSGLKNAVERGYSLNSAKQSLINSGYNLNEVNEAASYLSSGIESSQYSANQPEDNSYSEPQNEDDFSSQYPLSQSQKNNTEKIIDKKFLLKVLGLGLVLAGLVVVLVYVLLKMYG